MGRTDVLSHLLRQHRVDLSEIYRVTVGQLSAGQAYQGEWFPTRVRGTAICFLGAMQLAGFVIGTTLCAVLMASVGPTITWWIISVGLAFGIWSSVFLRRI